MTTQAMSNDVMKALGQETARQLICLFESNEDRLVSIWNKRASGAEGDVITVSLKVGVTLKLDDAGNFKAGTSISASVPFSDKIEPNTVHPGQPDLFDQDGNEIQPEPEDD